MVLVIFLPVTLALRPTELGVSSLTFKGNEGLETRKSGESGLGAKAYGEWEGQCEEEVITYS